MGVDTRSAVQELAASLTDAARASTRQQLHAYALHDDAARSHKKAPFPNPCIHAAYVFWEEAQLAQEGIASFEAEYGTGESRGRLQQASLVQRLTASAMQLYRSAEVFLHDMDPVAFACFKVVFPKAPLAKATELLSMPSFEDAERNLKILSTDRIVQAEIVSLSADRQHGAARLDDLTGILELDYEFLLNLTHSRDSFPLSCLRGLFSNAETDTFSVFTKRLAELFFDDATQTLRLSGCRPMFGKEHAGADREFEDVYKAMLPLCRRHFFVLLVAQQAQQKCDALYKGMGSRSFFDSDGVVAAMPCIASFLCPAAAARLRRVSTIFRDNEDLADRAPHLRVRATDQRAALPANRCVWVPYDRSAHPPLPQGRATHFAIAARGWPRDLMDALSGKKDHAEFMLHALIAEQLPARLYSPLDYATDSKGRMWIPKPKRPPSFCQFDAVGPRGSRVVVSRMPIVLDISVVSKATVPDTEGSTAAAEATQRGSEYFRETYRLLNDSEEGASVIYTYPDVGGGVSTLSTFYGHPANIECINRPWGQTVCVPDSVPRGEEWEHVGAVQVHPRWAQECKFEAYLVRLCDNKCGSTEKESFLHLPWTAVPYADVDKKKVPQPALYSDEVLVYPAIGRCCLCKALSEDEMPLQEPRRRSLGGQEREMAGRAQFGSSSRMRKSHKHPTFYSIEVRAVDEQGRAMGCTRTPAFEILARSPGTPRKVRPRKRLSSTAGAS